MINDEWPKQTKPHHNSNSLPGPVRPEQHQAGVEANKLTMISASEAYIFTNNGWKTKGRPHRRSVLIRALVAFLSCMPSGFDFGSRTEPSDKWLRFDQNVRKPPPRSYLTHALNHIRSIFFGNCRNTHKNKTKKQHPLVDRFGFKGNCLQFYQHTTAALSLLGIAISGVISIYKTAPSRRPTRVWCVSISGLVFRH